MRSAHSVAERYFKVAVSTRDSPEYRNIQGGAGRVREFVTLDRWEKMRLPLGIPSGRETLEVAWDLTASLRAVQVHTALG